MRKVATPFANRVTRNESVQMSVLLWCIFNEARANCINYLVFADRLPNGQIARPTLPCTNLWQVMTDLAQSHSGQAGIDTAFCESLYIELMEWSNGMSETDLDIGQLLSVMVPEERQKELKNLYVKVG